MPMNVIPEYMTIWNDRVLADALRNQLRELHEAAALVEKATNAVAAITAEMQRRQPVSS